MWTKVVYSVQIDKFEGNGYRDVIENYSLRYHGEQGYFIFRNKRYSSLREFVQDPEYTPILRIPLSKQTIETVKESKYKSDSDFLAPPSQVKWYQRGLL